MQYAVVKRGKTSEIVRADGSTVQPSDADRRLFHVLPKLFVDPDDLQRLRCEAIAVRITSDRLGDSLEPPGGSVVRQPVPNRRYFVGGSRDSRFGWLVPIPEAIDGFDMTMEWRIAEGADDPNYTIRHTLLVKLLPGHQHVYSMDLSCWHGVGAFGKGDAPIRHQPYARLYGDGFQESRKVEIDGFDTPDDGEENRRRPAIIAYREVLEIPAIAVSDLWSINAFSEEQLHEIAPRTAFRSGNDLHRANACIELPAAVFTHAVELARDIPCDRGSWTPGDGQAGPCERHPALRRLCDWWNRHAPAPETRCAGYAMPWVRVREDGHYWCGYGETPDTPIENFRRDAKGQARIGDLVLIEFMKGAKDFTFDESGLQTYNVTGNEGPWVGIGEAEVRSGDYDEAWYSLEALAGFPHRFPKAWEALLGLARDSQSKEPSE
jgi:hypothetical protein